MLPENDNTRVLDHMLGYLNENQFADAKSQGLSGDILHLLGYLEDKHWIEAAGIFKNQQGNLSRLTKMAMDVDKRYNTNFCEDISEAIKQPNHG